MEVETVARQAEPQAQRLPLASRWTIGFGGLALGAASIYNANKVGVDSGGEALVAVGSLILSPTLLYFGFRDGSSGRFARRRLKVGERGSNNRAVATRLAIISTCFSGSLVGIGLINSVQHDEEGNLASASPAQPAPTDNNTTEFSNEIKGPCELVIMPDGDSVATDDVVSKMKLQAGLNEMGFEAGPVDGWIYKESNEALRAFKIEYKFNPDKDIDEEMCQFIPSLVDGNSETPAIPLTTN